MLYFIIVFFLLIYIIGELCKYKKLESFKNKDNKKIYNKPVVYLKCVALFITLILLIVNRFTKNGVIERSNNILTTILFVGVMLIFIALSCRDLWKMNKDDLSD